MHNTIYIGANGRTSLCENELEIINKSNYDQNTKVHLQIKYKRKSNGLQK